MRGGGGGATGFEVNGLSVVGEVLGGVVRGSGSGSGSVCVRERERVRE